MKTISIVLALVVTLTAFAALAPTAEARQVCTYGTGDPCDDHAACVWNRVTMKWDCFVYVDPCWFRCWLP